MSTVFWGLFIPFLGTMLGASCVFFMRRELNETVQRVFMGFAAGVMTAASVWSLLIPSMNISRGMQRFVFFPALTGFACGVFFLFVLDKTVPHVHAAARNPEGPNTKLSRTVMLVFAATLHNIPEGMAVGVLFSGMVSGNTQISAAAAFALSIGIAVQNFPEGAIISMPLRTEGNGRLKSFWYSILSGIVEPAAAVLTILLTTIIPDVLPYFLSFAAGAVIYVVVEELIPEAARDEKTDACTISFAAGFAFMMVLDAALI
ncbi:MAG: ZIP family metal transporter [Treponema sp.]